jgi:hypothetical protein
MRVYNVFGFSEVTAKGRNLGGGISRSRKHRVTHTHDGRSARREQRVTKVFQNKWQADWTIFNFIFNCRLKLFFFLLL